MNVKEVTATSPGPGLLLVTVTFESGLGLYAEMTANEDGTFEPNLIAAGLRYLAQEVRKYA